MGKAGTILRLDDTFAELQQLGGSIETEMARQRFPATLNAYQMGQPVVFESLMVTPEGLVYESSLLPWSEVKSIKVASGTVVIRRQWQPLIEEVAVPNVEVFKMLVQHIKSERARQCFPATLNSYQMNDAVVFGSLTVTREGLSHRSGRLSWAEMESIETNEIYDCHLVIRKQGKRFAWASVDLADVPTVEVFKMLVHYIRGVSIEEI